ncbi:MAG TPA: hypothetical protein VGJ21_19335 [Terracidiphilus sp.]|jgi:peptidoglycan/LPS O-acetylase OafA/YrhL
MIAQSAQNTSIELAAHGQRLLALPIVIAVSCVSHYSIERPFMRIRDGGKSRSVLMDDGLHHAQAESN